MDINAEEPDNYTKLYHLVKQIIYSQRRFDAVEHFNINHKPPIIIKLIYNEDFTEMNKTDESS